MKETFNHIKALDESINLYSTKLFKAYASCTEYSIEEKCDINADQSELKHLYRRKFDALESLQMEIEKEKQILSRTQKALSRFIIENTRA